VRRALAFAFAAATMLMVPAAHAQDAAEGPQSAPLSAEQMAALDHNFNAAVQAARDSLPVFWQRLASSPDSGPDTFGLKVTFKSPRGGNEEVWLQDVKRDGARIVGRLNYDPENLPRLHRNDIVPIREADIIDWSFKEGRKRYGEFTTRVLASIHPAESAKTMATLSDNPLPLDARK
jgi:uncharacterized protein YegJ (DUF2314 family)